MDPPEQKNQSALEWKDEGNIFFQRKDYARAVEAYESGLEVIATSMADGDTMDVDDASGAPVSIALRSNLAMVLIKLEDFQRAEQECSGILKEDPENSKVLYRRAMAREGSAMSTNGDTSLEQQRTLLVKAMDDLQQCLNVLDKTKMTQQQKQPQEPLSKTDRTTKISCRRALDRLEKKYNQLMASIEQQNTNADQKTNHDHYHHANENGYAPTPTTTTAPPQSEALAKQKKDVMRLLMGRQVSTEKTPPVGEAFFLLEWRWWCQWCREVDFFYVQDKDQQRAKERINKILGMLPPGAILPPDKEDDDDDDDDDDDSSSDSSSKPLGPIDNSRLLSQKTVFHKHWYDTSSLRPNLVRGYHYELLPREVYNALRSWYGETTPSLCRRTTDDRIVVLYPPAAQPKHSAAATKHKCSACRAPGTTSRCKRCMSVQYCDRLCQEAHWPFHKVLCKAVSNGSNTVPPQQLQHGAEGRVGLNNLGNTCFMNSALQCLSHATPLTRHFLSGKFRADLNASNPLGTGGKLAMAYDAVMKDLWMKSKGTAMSPTALKRAIALFAPRFAGCLQHDAQEFLAYLLDGLHEDLNRIQKAPYVEMPDVTDGQNMAIAGAEAWDAHKRRNDSLVLDTFYGQFQSTCVCPKCNRVSVSFDAYNHVSLEIPQLNKLTVTIPVLVFRTGSHEMPYRYGVTLHRQSLIADLRSELGTLTGISPNRLTLADVYENSIFELLHDKKPVSNIRPNDVLAAYEIDPYTQSSIHAVANHSLLVIDQNGQEQRPLFGFPFMTSFDAGATCQQLWEHLWDIVDHMVSQEGSEEGYVDRRGKYLREDILNIRFVNSQSQQVKVFPGEDGTPTAILPIDSDVEVRKYLGEGCTENFLFLALEWKNPTDLEEDEDKLVDPKAFVAYADHKSLVEAVHKQRAQNGMKGVTLDQCFETFTKPERLDDNNKWYCSKCKEHVRALKTIKLWRLPNILVVHLKRFEFKHALRRDKLDTFVDFPLDSLDMTRHCASFEETNNGEQPPFVDARVPAEYDLFAIVNHFGRMGFGHYTAFARRWDETGMSKEWALFDDSSVRSVGSGTGPDGVVTPAAYVLFYRRRTFN